MITGNEASYASPRHITSIEVRGLFGHLNYSIPPSKYDSGFDDLLILYGDNGSGKTTILRMVFYLLATRTDRGYKTHLTTIPFKTFEIRFGDGASVIASRPETILVGDYTISVTEPKHGSKDFPLKVDAEGGIDSGENPVRELIQALTSLNVSLYFLPDDRQVQVNLSGSVPEDLQPRRTVLRSSRGEIVRMIDPDSELSRDERRQRESHHLQVGPVLHNLVSSFRQQTISGSNTGEENASVIYLRVVNQLRSYNQPSEPNVGVADEALVRRLETLGKTAQKFAGYGFVATFPAERFIASFNEANPRERVAIREVLTPYLEGLEARLKALQEIYDVASTYVETLNSFLANKTIELNIRDGITVTSKWGETLNVNMLSSGERQLLLLLSNTILARGRSSIFIIDEPELSLNVTWQRRLVEALLKCSLGGGIQYILASHSLELITQYRSRTVKLEQI